MKESWGINYDRGLSGAFFKQEKVYFVNSGVMSQDPPNTLPIPSQVLASPIVQDQMMDA